MKMCSPNSLLHTTGASLLLATAASLLALCPGPALTVGQDDAAPVAASGCNSSTAKLLLSSHRNGSGEWVARVRLLHDDVDSATSDRWRVDVQHTILHCPDGEDLVLMEANVTIPRGEQVKELPPPTVSSQTRPVKNLSIDSTPPPNYTLVPGLGHYRYHDDWLVWQDARSACEDEGGHLIVPDSEEEYNTISQLSSKHPWVGLFYHKEQGEYVSVLGESLDSLPYVRWAQGEPDKSGNCIFFNGLTKALYDEPCGFVEVFVCEAPL